MGETKRKKIKGIRLEYVAQHISHAGSHSNEKLKYTGGHFLFLSPSSLGRALNLVMKVPSLRDQLDYWRSLQLAALFKEFDFMLQKFKRLCQPVLKSWTFGCQKICFCLWLFFQSPHYFVMCSPHFSLPHCFYFFVSCKHLFFSSRKTL